ncbi:hypothetical protein FACS1894180_1630 [Bacteroidia bacterium]|nr:hypothetical protein FACS1894180_1630 [Bacteroidia bacterium]
MTDENTQKILVFDEKIKALCNDYQELKNENRLLREQADNARNEWKIAHKEFVDLQEEYRHFRLAVALTGGGDDAQTAEMRTAIEKSVREIDTCLKLLND